MKSYYDVNSSCQKYWDKLEMNPKGCRYTETRTLLLALGFVESNGAGSRIKFYHPETKKIVSLHKPHPKDMMDTGSAKDVRDVIHEFYKQKQ